MLGMCALSDGPANLSVVLDREPDQEKSLDPSGPRIRCQLCVWTPRKRWIRDAPTPNSCAKETIMDSDFETRVDF
jgi:hypothetical protein